MRAGWCALALVLVALALARPVDHDESQYVAAAVLTAHGLLPYRDYAYLQTPLQPFVLAPVAWLAGVWAWPALRVANALLGVAAVGFVHAAMRRIGATPRVALACAGLFVTCDILLFSIGTARNDALPAALFAAAIWLAVRADREGATPVRAALTGLLLAAAAAAKISYALPAAAYGLYALADRRHRPWWVAGGAVPVAAFVLWTIAVEPAGFVFGVLTFPSRAPADYYAGHAWKLSGTAKALDTLKFLALGPALMAGAAVARARRRRRRPGMLDLLIVTGLVAALLPSPTWRQYLLPVLPPLFIRLAQIWSVRPPGRRVRVAAVVFAFAGLAPSAESLARGGTLFGALRDGRAVGMALDAAKIDGPVATLSPQLLPATRRLPDPRLATGPFHFRSTALVTPAQEAALHLVSRATLARAPLPAAVLTGGEAGWTSGDTTLDTAMEAEAIRRGYRRLPVAGRLRLWIRPPAPASPQSATGNRP